MTELRELTDQDAIDLLDKLGQLSLKASQQNEEASRSQPCLSALPIELIAEITGYLDLASVKSLFLSNTIPQVHEVNRDLTELTTKVLIPENIVPVKAGGKNDWKKTLERFNRPIQFQRSRIPGHVIVQKDFVKPQNPGSGTWMKSKAFIDGARLQVDPVEENLGFVVDFKEWTLSCVRADYDFTPPGELVDTVQYFDETMAKVYLTLNDNGVYCVHRVRANDDVTSVVFDGKTSVKGEAKLPHYVNNIGEILLHYDHNRDEGDGWPDMMGDQYVIDWERKTFVLVKENVTMWGGSTLPSMCPNGLFITHNRPMHWTASNPVTGASYHDGEDMVEIHGYSDTRFCVYDVRNIWHVMDCVDMTIRPLNTWWDYSTLSERGVQYFEEDKHFEICQIPFHDSDSIAWKPLVKEMKAGDVKPLNKP